MNNENGGKMCKCTAARSHSDQASYRKAGIVVTFIVCGKAIKHQPPVVSARKGNTVRLQDKSLTRGKDREQGPSYKGSICSLEFDGRL